MLVVIETIAFFYLSPAEHKSIFLSPTFTPAPTLAPF